MIRFRKIGASITLRSFFDQAYSREDLLELNQEGTQVFEDQRAENIQLSLNRKQVLVRAGNQQKVFNIGKGLTSLPELSFQQRAESASQRVTVRVQNLDLQVARLLGSGLVENPEDAALLARLVEQSYDRAAQRLTESFGRIYYVAHLLFQIFVRQ